MVGADLPVLPWELNSQEPDEGNNRIRIKADHSFFFEKTKVTLNT